MKSNWKNIWINARIVLIAGLLIFLYSFTAKRNAKRKLKKATIEFVGEGVQYVAPEVVNKMLVENGEDVKSITKEGIDLNSVEKSINKNGIIDKAEVFVTIDGQLKAKVKQKLPIARITDGDDSFYLDYEGEKMPLSKVHSARLPLVLGRVNDENRAGLTELFRYIYNDPFLRENIIGAQVYDNGALVLANRIYNFKIDFGRTIHIERKFKNYKAFYQKAVQDSSIGKYKTINLRFTKQVVCTK